MDNKDTKADLIHSGIILPSGGLYKKYRKLLKEQPVIQEEIELQTNFLEYDAPINARLHCIIQDITEQPKCTTCGNILKMRLDGRYRFTFAATCGSKCFLNSDTIKDKRRATNIDRYGSPNYLTSERGKRQTEQSNMERYGVKNVLELKETKEKAKTTMLERYGVEHPMHSPVIKEKQKQTVRDSYGVDNVWLSADIQKKRFDTMQEHHGVDYAQQSPELKAKQKQTMTDRYGVEFAHQHKESRDKFSDTMVEQYGVEHALQSHLPKESIDQRNDVEWLREQHIDNKRTIADIASEIGYSATGLGKALKQHNIPVHHYYQSTGENDMFEYIKSLLPGEEIIQGDIHVLKGRELDIYVPSLNVAFEYNGVYWHSELNGKDRRYHSSKTTECNAKGIRLVHIFDFEWLTKQDIVKSRIEAILGVSKSVYARKCQIIIPTKKQVAAFMVAHHIQGKCGSKYEYALTINDDMVALMSFGKSRFSGKFEYELIRYVNKIGLSVTGGASKLFKAFIKEHNPKSIITYSDVRWNTGNLYHKIGFVFTHRAKPNYFYFDKTDPSVLLSRQTFQKHKLSKKLATFDPNLTEWENTSGNGYDRIWDCGNDVFVWYDKDLL